MQDANFSGLSELRDVRRELRGIMVTVGLFSLFMNLLMLTGPLFMLQTYDRVLSARSESTLVALVALMAFMFLIMGLLDWARGRLLTRMGARFQARLDRRVFNAILKRSVSDQKIDEKTGSGQQLKDLEAVNRFYASPVFAALFDAPWTPVFLIGLGYFHPWIGAFAVTGGCLLALSAVLNQYSTRTSSVKAAVSGFVSDRYADQLRDEAETIRSLGMQSNAFEKWGRSREKALDLSVRSADMGGTFSSLSRIFRMFLQSAMLGLGAYLVLQGQIAPGVMIASSILMGRALQPVETLINQWPMVQRSKRAWDNLAALLAEVDEDKPTVELPRPRARLEVQGISVTPPKGKAPTLRQVSFSINPGEAIGVIGPSGAGKSTLARCLTGVWPLTSGKIKLDGAPLDQYHPERLSEYIGYLPQRVSLFDGTVAENIARLSQKFDHERVIEAARKAAAHDMILRLPQGYNTPVQSIGTQLSGGQIQRIGLARALYGNPVLLVLDEPNSNLDNEGSVALNRAIIAMKEAGNAVMIMAHRPSAIKECDKLLVLEDGTRKAWGPREQVMSEMLANVQVIRKAVGGLA
ncbi:type I secretion system permease/ATPase [Gemmobacter nectariphilus]|uniref:type I secretion system permease/ATPase n=1 Tax=Gemmobacter nectariphilus TaxID=220343 RepID=UPI0003FF39C6|nr:type I secretion system permease/ATPase [Gemmobacter nectariphilus]